MAGHSKWANVKHRKAAQDAKRGKLWTKVLREVAVAARLGGGEPSDNPRLRAALDKAAAANVPRDTVDRAVARGIGGGEGASLEELVYEGYAPGGVAILVEAMTDNRNRTVAEVRRVFARHGGNLGTDGSVAYLFRRQGLIGFPPGADEGRILDVALEAGAEDLESEADGGLSVVAPVERFGPVLDALRAASLSPQRAELAMLASVACPCSGEQAAKALRLIDALEDLDDVQNVYSNGEFPDALFQDGSAQPANGAKPPAAG